MAKDIYKDDSAVRYKVKCQQCTQTFLVYEVFASIPEHPDLNSKGPYRACPGSRKPGTLIETIPKGKKL
jgi:hypothetical protein